MKEGGITVQEGAMTIEVEVGVMGWLALMIEEGNTGEEMKADPP